MGAQYSCVRKEGDLEILAQGLLEFETLSGEEIVDLSCGQAARTRAGRRHAAFRSADSVRAGYPANRRAERVWVDLIPSPSRELDGSTLGHID